MSSQSEIVNDVPPPPEAVLSSSSSAATASHDQLSRIEGVKLDAAYCRLFQRGR
jgi:hypothetical protein